MELDTVKICRREEPSKFDYDAVSPSVAKFLRGQAERIRHSCSTSIVQSGKALIEAKRHLSHGEFVRWVGSEIGIPVRTAQAYMQVAQWVKGKSGTVANLPPSILYVLSGRNTPPDFTARLLERHEAGEEIDARLARAELKALRMAKCKPVSEYAQEVTDCSEQSISEMENCQDGVERFSLIKRMITILLNHLSEEEFEEIRGIFLMESIIADGNLGFNIASAFSRVERAGTGWSDTKFGLREFHDHEGY
jgi:Protein of unknown function (DUF3102)